MSSERLVLFADDEGPWYAHSRLTADDDTEYQLLEDHLSGVADFAAHFAGSFGAESFGRALGMLHDLGKAHSSFQDRLRGSTTSFEHSGAGARLAWSGLPRDVGTILAFAVAGHHTGLANAIESGPGLPTPLKDRMSEGALCEHGTRERVLDLLGGLDLRRPGWITTNRKTGEPRSASEVFRSTEMFIRFLFSSLVDADWLDTEAWVRQDSSPRRGGFPDVDELARRLDRHLETLREGLSEDALSLPINGLRARVLDRCRAMADCDPGCFALTVPTGGGKTLSSMVFALNHARTHGLERVIVVIPYTSIIEQSAQVYREALGGEAVVEHHASLDEEKRNDERRSLASENWDAPVIVTTTVQFFESLFSSKSSRCRKVHSIARSVVVLDEVQSLPPGMLLPILDALKELEASYGCSIVLSTATPPAFRARKNFEAGFREIREIVDHRELDQHLPKRVTFDCSGLDVLSDDEVLADALEPDAQALVVVNTRRAARNLAKCLEARYGRNHVFHLSALMCARHRSRTLAAIKARLRDGRPCRTVSTQLIEAGVDIDFPVVHRAIAGMDSLVQAAGRCNREGRLERGIVHVFRPEERAPSGTPRKGADVMAGMLRARPDLLNENFDDVFEDYFRRLYLTERLDKKGIQEARAGLNFATVNRDFKLIEDDCSHSIVVPWEEAVELLDDVNSRSPRDLLRALQVFTVRIYDRSFKQLFEAGALDEFVDGMFRLTAPYEHLYDPVYGLVVDESLAADPETLIL